MESEFVAMIDKVEQLETEVNTIQSKIESLRPAAETAARRWIKLGLTMPVAQFLLIFYGTFEYLSWDIMEPVCYLMTFGNFTFGYAFYLIYHQDLECDSVFEILTKRSLKKRARAIGLDMDELEAKQEELNELR